MVFTPKTANFVLAHSLTGPTALMIETVFQPNLQLPNSSSPPQNAPMARRLKTAAVGHT